MINELKPCPFCNGKLAVNQDENGWWHHSCTEYCYLSAGFPTEAEAIIAANTRYKRTCRVVPMDYFGQPPYYRGSIVSDALSDGCSECGYPFDTINKGVPIFCPNCGAEVIDGDS